MAKKTVTISSKVGENYVVDLKARNFSLKIDQPIPMGTDQGPTPLEYFFFALGGCVCTIGRIIAQQKKLPVKSIEVRIEGDLDVDVLMGKNKTDRAGFTDIKVYTKIDAPMSKEEKEAFLKEIDTRCPISDNIEKTSSVKLMVEE
ncbi:MAG: OsmC family protein [Candidatus Cloacimonetes bacterium]|jgi:uncharacterized OsmC-like protein|nr:OsmC family protein [Candidatus Cloacimonadota bacterium]MDD4156023.1 OsmC family protein [Candidatus Cloacimonadota bacterium]